MRIRTALAVAGLSAAGLMGATGPAAANSGAQAAAIGSPGVASGNVVQVPVTTQTNICGNTASVAGTLNPSFGNVCVNHR